MEVGRDIVAVVGHRGSYKVEIVAEIQSIYGCEVQIRSCPALEIWYSSCLLVFI